MKGFYMMKNAIFLLLIFVFVGQGMIIYSNTDLGKDFSSLLIYQLFFIYFSILYTAFKKFGIGNTFSIFLVCLGLFNYQKFFWDWALDEDFRKAESLISIHLAEIVVQKTLFIYSVFTVFVFVSYSHFSKANKVFDENRIQHSFDKRLYVMGLTVFIFALPFSIYKSYLEFISLFGKSYTEYYMEGNGVSIAFYLRFAVLLFQVGYMVILTSVPRKQNFFISSALYIIVLVPYLFVGLRANFAVSLLCIFWYYFNVYRGNINIRKIIIPVFLLISTLQVIAVNRDRGEANINYFKLIPSFLYQQSQSMYVLALYIEYKDEIAQPNLPFVLDPLTSWIFPSGQSVEVVKSRSSLGHSLTYSLSPQYYLSGSSLGTNFIAEIYEFGLFGVLIGAVLFGCLIAVFERKVQKSLLYLFLSLIILQYFFLAPRSNFLPVFYFIFRTILVYFFLLVIFGLFNKKYFK